jgi:murein L,D-transpeptidase YcbB/YkuD
MIGRTFPLGAVLGLLIAWGSGVIAEPALATQELLRGRMEQLQAAGGLQVDGSTVAAVRLIPELYQRRGFRLAWTAHGANVQALMRLIAASDQHGLDPQDYHWQALKDLQARLRERADPRLQVDLDILLTDALVRLGYHMRFGKVDPEALDPDWNLSRDLEGGDPVDIIQAAIDSEDLEAFIDRYVPHIPIYGRLKAALARYREIRSQGGWPTVPAGPALKSGMRDLRMTALRRRLAAGGYLAGDPVTDESLFDGALEQAVIRFQKGHGLDADGVVGAQTLAALNVPVEGRIDQIRVNLERARWVFQDISKDYVLVDIAGFQAHMVKDGRLVWASKVQVGKPYRKTPVFKSSMTYVVLNPTWTVPPTILAKDILPRVRRDPSYLERKRLRVVDRKGRIIDPKTLDWSRYTGRNFPYFLRQDPGPDNALGRIKFMFPNKHLVYLHDTPHQELFRRTERAFSSGCIRIEHPFALAELLLDDPRKWSREQILAAIDTHKTQTVFLPRPIKVLLLYWTVDVDEQGRVWFRKDLYGRDKKVLAALEGEFVIRAPLGMPDWYRP